MPSSSSQPLIRQHFTQSEKQRYFVDNGGSNPFQMIANTSQTKPRYKSARIVECPQNVVELRKMLQRCKSLDSAKARTVARISREQNLLKTKYKELLQNKDDNELLDDFDTQASLSQNQGSGYRSNRDLRKPNAVLSTQLAIALKRDLKSSGPEDPSPANTGEHSLENVTHQHLKQQIKEIEEELKTAKSNKDIRHINKRLASIKTSVQNLREKDSRIVEKPKDVPVLTPKTDEPEPAYRGLSLTIQPSRRFSHTSGQTKVTSDTTIETPKVSKPYERFSRQCNKRSCTACDHRMKCKTDNTSPLQTKRKPVRRWKHAPRGEFVSRVDSQLEGHRPKRREGTKSSMGFYSVDKKVSSKDNFRSKSAYPIVYTHSVPLVKKEESKTFNVGRSRCPQSVQTLSEGSSVIDIVTKLPSTEEIYRDMMTKSSITDKDQQKMLRRMSEVSEVGSKMSMQDHRVRKIDGSSKNIERSDALVDPQRNKAGGDCRPVVKVNQSNLTVKTLSALTIKLKLESENEEMSAKVQTFLLHIPECRSSIDRWRSSDGKTMKHSSLDETMTC